MRVSFSSFQRLYRRKLFADQRQPNASPINDNRQTKEVVGLSIQIEETKHQKKNHNILTSIKEKKLKKKTKKEWKHII
jgi:hypothetical protein